MPLPAPFLHALVLVLTARCNLQCGYCYQNAKQARSMGRSTLYRALDLVSRMPRLPRLVFVGGEPLLESGLLREAILYWESHTAGPEGTPQSPLQPRARCTVITNGTVLDKGLLAFLVEHDVEVQLSFDGVAEAQRRRGSGTFALLDSLLDNLRQKHSAFFDDRVQVSLTLTPDTVGTLAASIRYFVGKSVPRISISSIFTDASSWDPARIVELEAQFQTIHEEMLAHYRKTGAIPLDLLRPDPAATRLSDPSALAGRWNGRPAAELRAVGDIDRRRVARLSMCGVGRGEVVTVDVDGTCYGCMTFARSFQRIESPLLSRLQSIPLGSVHEEPFALRLAPYRRVLRSMRIFDDKQRKRSSYGACDECPYLTTCGVCPMSIGHCAGNQDSDRVPDFACAFQRVSLQARSRFAMHLLPGTTPELSNRRKLQRRFGRGDLANEARTQGAHFAAIRRFAARLS